MVLGIAGVLCLVLWGLYLWLPGEHELKDLAAILQAVVATTAIIYAGIVAIAKLEVFRHFEPHLTVSHIINHRPIGNSYVHIDVTATLHNSSRVKVELREGEFYIQEIGPVLDDQELEEQLTAREFIAADGSFVQWPTIGKFSCYWGNYNLVVEPGQIYRETVEFVVSKEIGTVAIHSRFHRETATGEAPQGWGMTTVYDMIDAATDSVG